MYMYVQVHDLIQWMEIISGLDSNIGNMPAIPYFSVYIYSKFCYMCLCCLDVADCGLLFIV